MGLDPEGNLLLFDIADVKFSNVRQKETLEAWLWYYQHIGGEGAGDWAEKPKN